MSDQSPYIATEFGRALVWFDEPVGADPGWVLRYHRAGPDNCDVVGQRDLDEPLPCVDPDGACDARAAALTFLDRMNIRVL